MRADSTRQEKDETDEGYQKAGEQQRIPHAETVWFRLVRGQHDNLISPVLFPDVAMGV